MFIPVKHTNENGYEIADIYNMNFVKTMCYYEETSKLFIGYTDGKSEILSNIPKEEFNKIEKWLCPYF